MGMPPAAVHALLVVIRSRAAALRRVFVRLLWLEAAATALMAHQQGRESSDALWRIAYTSICRRTAQVSVGASSAQNRCYRDCMHRVVIIGVLFLLGRSRSEVRRSARTQMQVSDRTRCVSDGGSAVFHFVNISPPDHPWSFLAICYSLADATYRSSFSAVSSHRVRRRLISSMSPSSSGPISRCHPSLDTISQYSRARSA
jgi:hypothetical protein